MCMCIYLFGFEACEAEHPNLVNDVLPVVSGALLFQTSHQLLSHLYDAVRHAMDLLQPELNDSRVQQVNRPLLTVWRGQITCLVQVTRVSIRQRTTVSVDLVC